MQQHLQFWHFLRSAAYENDQLPVNRPNAVWMIFLPDSCEQFAHCD